MITKYAPAKINLHLAVLRKREDGYHDIATLMQKVSLYDELTFSPLAGDIVVTCPGTSLPEDEGNIVYRAAQAFFSHISYRHGVAVTVKKSIPQAAGLGGGSSDAAATLLALNEMTGSVCTGESLMKLGAVLGADVPFFIYGPSTAWATGRGDCLMQAEDLSPFWYFLVNPGFPVSTKSVYEGLNLGLTKETIHYSIPRFRVRPENNSIEGLKNDLEEVTLTRHPFLHQLKAFMLDCGALGSLMSGSGPTIFGVFATETQARNAKESLTAKGWGTLGMYVVRAI